MGFVDSIAGLLGYTKAESAPGFLLRTAANERYTIPDFGLADNQLKLYQAVGWVQDAVSILSQTAAGAGSGVLNTQGEDKEDVINHPFEQLLSKPNPTTSRFHLWEATFACMRLAGNGYWWLNRTSPNSPPAEIYYLLPNRIKPIPGKTLGLLRGYEWNVGGGETLLLQPWEVVHFKEFHPRNMFSGLSRAESIAKEAEKDSKAALYDLNFFAEDFAKPEGILGWNGIITDEEKESLTSRFTRRHGGTKRSIAMMQNVEDLSYVQLALNYADMEFIANRTFTRDQIYNHYAPGLASVLAVNATEANSRTGKATLMEMGIWPMHVSVAETITNSILPAYGDNLIFEFEDVRLSDTAIELQEIDRAMNVMTIDEIRKRFWNLGPMEDGDKPVKGSNPNNNPFTQVPPQEEPSRFMETGGQQSDEQESDGQMKAHPIAVMPDGQIVEVEHEEPDNPIASIKAELDTWQRWVLKRLKAGKAVNDMRRFETDVIPPGLYGAIEGALEAVQSVENVRSIFTDALGWAGYP